MEAISVVLVLLLDEAPVFIEDVLVELSKALDGVEDVEKEGSVVELVKLDDEILGELRELEREDPEVELELEDVTKDDELSEEEEDDDEAEVEMIDVLELDDSVVDEAELDDLTLVLDDAVSEDVVDSVDVALDDEFEVRLVVDDELEDFEDGSEVELDNAAEDEVFEVIVIVVMVVTFVEDELGLVSAGILVVGVDEDSDVKDRDEVELEDSVLLDENVEEDEAEVDEFEEKLLVVGEEADELKKVLFVVDEEDSVGVIVAVPVVGVP
ncbi:hypothetical protein DPSP01_005175 [Paraphaeosphaeria sporulosa]